MEDWDIKTILVAYDGSDGAKRAAELAGSLARRNSARIVVVAAFRESRGTEVAKDHTYMGPASIEMSTQLGAAIEAAQALAREYEAAGIAVEVEVLEGAPAEMLLKAAGTHDADLIVVGRHGHGAARERIIGSTSESVVRGAHAPVLVAH